MLKTILLGSILTLGLGAGAGFAQDRTISVWGHDLTVSETAPRPQGGFVALASPDMVRDQAAPVARHRHHAR